MTPIAFGKDLSSATALSTPPLIATATRPALRGARKTGPIALASASTGKRLPANGSSLEQSQPNKRTIEPGSISLDNALAIKRQPHKRELGTTRRITNELNHKLRLAAIPASAGSAGARHPAPKCSVTRCSAVKSSWRAEGAADFIGLTLPCPTPL